MDQQVTVGLDADVSGYTTSLTQAIASTEAYSQAADNIIGKVARLNMVTTTLMKATSGLTGANKVATAQAAAYQQKLSGIEASAKVTGKNFAELEKTTKGFAKQFPIGMDRAVEVVRSLQTTGVSTNKEIRELGKTFVQLGAANGGSASQMGASMIQLGRTFGNATYQASKLGDSLTSVTNKYGANAQSVLDFSKAIAPISATVGATQTQVTGLSTAFSRIGEDGFAAANAFNKVMLDMNRSIREGTGEAESYAAVMGKSAVELKRSFEKSPVEGFLQFTEALNNKGTDSIRILESLGIEGTRTMKSLTSLYRSGDARKIVQEAQASFGSGSTESGAETAMGGVNDQMAKLQETMSQTVANAGKPFLGFLEMVASVANKVASAIESITGSGALQTLAKVMAVGGFVGGAALKGVGNLSMVSFGTNLLKMAGRSRIGTEFREGMGVGRSGIVDNDQLSDEDRARVQSRVSKAGRVVGLALGPDPAMSLSERVAGFGKSIKGSVLNTGQLISNIYASDMQRAMDKQGYSTEKGTRLREGMSTAWASRREEGLGSAMRSMSQAMGEYGREMKSADGATRNATSGLRNLTKSSVEFGGFAATKAVTGIKAVGKGLFGDLLGQMSKGTMIGGALVAGFMGVNAYMNNKDQTREMSNRGFTDAYRMFNEFAEKTGIATKGLVGLAEATAIAANAIAAKDTDMESALSLNTEEISKARQPGYQRGYQADEIKWWEGGWFRGESAQKEALRVRGTLGGDPDPQALSRVMMDLTNQMGADFAQAVSTELQGLFEEDPMKISERLNQAGNDSEFMGFWDTAESRTYKEMSAAELTRATKDVSPYGPKAEQAKQMSEAQKIFENAQKEERLLSESEIETLAALTGGGDDTKRILKDMQKFRMGPSGFSTAELQGSFQDFIDRMANRYQGHTDPTKPWIKSEQGAAGAQGFVEFYDSMQKKGIDTRNPDYRSLAEESDLSRRMRESSEALEGLTGVSEDLGKSLTAVGDAAVEAGMMFGDFIKAGSPGVNDNLSIMYGKLLSGTGNIGDRATTSMMQAYDFMKQGGSFGDMRLRANQMLEGLDVSDGQVYEAVMNSMTALQMLQGTESPRRSQFATGLDMFQTAQKAQLLPSTSDERVQEQRNQMISQGYAAYTDVLSQMRNSVVQIDQFNLQKSRANRDFKIQKSRSDFEFNKIWDAPGGKDTGPAGEGRAYRDFNKNRLRSNQAYNRSSAVDDKTMALLKGPNAKSFDDLDKLINGKGGTKGLAAYDSSYAEQDFVRQLQRGQEDFKLQQERAKRDQGKQVARAETDFQTQQLRAQDDYNKQKLRGEYQYNLQMTRANADFNLQMTRADVDFKLQMKRADDDFNKQKARSQEDFDLQFLRMDQDRLKQLRRQAEDAAGSLYDPFKRRQMAATWSFSAFIGNLKDQAKAMADQMRNLDEMKKLGVSEQAIDVLKLADPSNAQQVTRMLRELKGTAGGVASLNEEVAKRVGLADTMSKISVGGKRSEEDYDLQRERASADYKKQLDRSQADFDLQKERGQTDFDLQKSRGNEDFATQQARALEDFNKQNEYAAADFKTQTERAQADFNLQMERVKADFQTQLDDMTADYLRGVNRQIDDFLISSQRQAAERKIQQQQENEDFDQQKKDAAADYTQQKKWSKEDFDRAQADALKDIQRSFTLMFKTYDDLEATFLNKVAGIGVKIPQTLKDAISQGVDAAKSAGAWADTPSYDSTPDTSSGSGSDASPGKVSNGEYEGGAPGSIKGAYSTSKYWKKATGGKGESGQWKGEHIGNGQLKWTRIGQNTTDVDAAAKHFVEGGEWNRKNWYGANKNTLYGSNGHNGLDIYANKGADVRSPFPGVVVWAGYDSSAWAGAGWSKLKKKNLKSWAGDHVVVRIKDDDGEMVDILYGHLSESKVKAGDTIKADQLIGLVGDTGNVNGAHLHLSAYETKGGAMKQVNPAKYFAEGGIATRQMNAVIAETGYPEAVIPLNEDGARFLQNMMVRYVGGVDVQTSRVGQHCTHVESTSNTYDQRTQFTGQITVQAQDPDDMARKLESKQRMQKLVQPIGRR